MSAARIDKIVWVLIYLGMILLALGLSLQRSVTAWGWFLSAAGVTAVAIGIALIGLRSRMKNKR